MTVSKLAPSRLVLLVVSLVVVGVLARPPQSPLKSEDGPVLASRALLKTLGASQRPLIADYYWLMTINQVGGADSASSSRDVFFYADMATDLDPAFRYAYEFGSLTLPFNTGDSWVNVDLSNRLLKKALKQFPTDARFKFQLAYNLMAYQREYRAAADLLMEASKAPNMPTFLPQLATRLYSQTGAFETAISAAQLLRDTAADDEAKAFYDRRITQIERERILQHVDRAVARFKLELGRLPNNIYELVERRYLPGIPKDPQGGEIFLDPTARARSTSGLYRLEVFEDDKKTKLRRDLGLAPDADLNSNRSGQ